MASVLKFLTDPIDLQEEIKRRDDFAETVRREKFIAARKIQAWYRGIGTRNHLRLLHEYAITIQRHWRGYRVRIYVDQYLVERVHQMWQDYYDRMATRIQAIWRGYWVRKTVLDISKMRRWLQNVYLKNEEAVANMNKFRQSELDHFQLIVEQESMNWILFILFKLHHLLRTKQRSGVITRIDKTCYTFIEEMLKCFEYRHYRRKDTRCKDCQIDRKTSLLLRGTYYERCERELREIEKSLQVGNVSICRSEPYEKQERILRDLNRVYREAAIHNKCETSDVFNINVKLKKSVDSLLEKASAKKTCCLKESNSQNICIGTNDLFEEIKKMDCHLDDLRIKCPVHNVSYSIS